MKNNSSTNIFNFHRIKDEEIKFKDNSNLLNNSNSIYHISLQIQKENKTINQLTQKNIISSYKDFNLNNTSSPNNLKNNSISIPNNSIKNYKSFTINISNDNKIIKPYKYFSSKIKSGKNKKFIKSLKSLRNKIISQENKSKKIINEINKKKYKEPYTYKSLRIEEKNSYYNKKSLLQYSSIMTELINKNKAK